MKWLFDGDDAFACCLVSSHPHAVRALETVTCKYCDVIRARQHYTRLVNTSNIPYMQGKELVENTCQVNTHFHIDHTDVKTLLNKIITKGQKWVLGDGLLAGHEFFACVFRDTPKSIIPRGGCIQLNKHELVPEKISVSLDSFAQKHNIVFTSTYSSYWEYHAKVSAKVRHMSDDGDIRGVVNVHDAKNPSFILEIMLV